MRLSTPAGLDVMSPSEVTTLVEVLEHRAVHDPDATAFMYADVPHSFGEVWRESGRMATRLIGDGCHSGEAAVVVVPNGPEFFTAFYGAQRAGAVPVPVYPGSSARRILDIARSCDASKIVVAACTPQDTVGRLQNDRLPVTVVDASNLETAPASSVRLPAVAADDLAFIQFTSGSTGNPRGVQLSHANLLTNIRQMIDGMEITDRDVFVSWLPVFHDMGLILKTMVPFYLAARLVLLPTSLAHVGTWLATIEAHRGTFTAAPDFAWRLLLRAVRDPGRYDLSSLRVALNAAEPVRAGTIREFERAFALRHVMVPGYGLAEASVGVSMQPPGTPFKVDDRGFVAIGRPFPGVRVSIVRGDDEAAVGEVGELVVRSRANTNGYLANAGATEELFWRPGWIRTGDLGYRDRDGDIFIVGRSKNIIIQGGRNLAPQEIEEAVEELGFVRRAAAVGVDRGRAEGEQAYVFAELRSARPLQRGVLEEMAIEVVAAIHDRLGMRPGRVYLVRPRTIPLTHSGKIRHGDLRNGVLSGELRDRIVFPEL